MKYKVGDKVRVRKDLEVGKVYNDVSFVSEMEKFCGEVVEIAEVYGNGTLKGCHIKEDRCDCFWAVEMFEPVITNFDKMREKMKIEDIENGGICTAINRIKKEEHCIGRKCSECIEWLKQPYEEPKKEILDKQEKEYLSAVIKPFRNRVRAVTKYKEETIPAECINIEVIGINKYLQTEDMPLPYFKKNSMYKGMEFGKRYTLEELGL